MSVSRLEYGMQFTKIKVTAIILSLLLIHGLTSTSLKEILLVDDFDSKTSVENTITSHIRSRLKGDDDSESFKYLKK